MPAPSKSASPSVRTRLHRRHDAVGLLSVAVSALLFFTGCVGSHKNLAAFAAVSTDNSPPSEKARPGAAWRLAKVDVAGLDTDCAEVMFGQGESMLPLYHDRTLLVVKRLHFETLKAGMTVVFSGDSGFPVAHVLVSQSRSGWTAAGVANGKCDTTRVTADNYRGTVVRAFELDWDGTQSLGFPAGSHQGPSGQARENILATAQ